MLKVQFKNKTNVKLYIKKYTYIWGNLCSANYIKHSFYKTKVTFMWKATDNNYAQVLTI